jgi:dihydrodipicolinate synthase/N-acetylneuraminate lyase
LRRAVRYLLEGGVRGIFALGGTGNFCAFTAEERYEVARTVVEAVGGRVPVLVGCMDSSTRLVIRNVRLAAEAGADGVVVEPPFYYPCTDEDVLMHFRAAAEASDLPIVIYNIPEANKVDIDLEMTRKLASIPQIIGVKDSTSDFVGFQALLAEFAGSEFRVIQGQETLAGASFLLGAPGAILAIGNVVPRLCVDLFEAGKAGMLEETLEKQAELMLAYDVLKRAGADPRLGAQNITVTVSSFFGGLECALDVLGICKRVTTVPYRRPFPAEHERVRGILEELKLAPLGA